ncbi:hypothetical protein [Parvularcula dongshanensis]|uniref:Uncharacterized protein n=1 Tax=Parvularcula dongshanensis TaxID=1173995 RepID=A0A840HYM9_9PROT|nr:hypothetical protein [Parvularcula dongshanensis]MBB4657679.1 hypothetical protein [Parvularcula dongshanensis]
MKKIYAAVFAAGLASAGPARAALEPATLTECLIENHEPSADAQFREFLIAALQENKLGAQKVMLTFGMGVASVAMQQCGVGMMALREPAFQKGVEGYGMWLGERVMTEAMAQIGL